MFDDGETGIPWAEVALDGTSHIANGLGQYTFQVAAAGVHTVVETDPPGYRSTTPNEVNIDVALGNSYLVNFGDTTILPIVQTFTAQCSMIIMKTACMDANETGIAGVTVTLDGTTSLVTNGLGQYTFLITTAGDHTVVETDLAGYRSTTDNDISKNVVLGNSYTANFGDIIVIDQCPDDPNKTEPGICGCGVSDTDTEMTESQIVMITAL